MSDIASKHAAALVAVPDELRQWHSWVLWREEQRDGKPTKIPYSDATTKARADDPETWHCWPDMLAVPGSFKGPGFVFSERDPYVGVDLDGCLNPETGEIAEWASNIIAIFPGAYVECSPSGTGIKLITKGRLPRAESGEVICRHKVHIPADPVSEKAPALEVYDTHRYFTVTGKPYGEPVTAIDDGQSGIDRLVEQYLVRDESPGGGDTERAAVHLDDHDLLDRARNATNGDRFRALFDAGDTSAHGGDDSSADQALANHLAFWTNGDADRIDRLFRASALYRKKWDERRGADTYGRRTINNALRDMREGYDPGTRVTTSPFLTTSPAPSAEVPPYPVEALNDPFSSYVSSAARAIGVPPEFVAVPLLVNAGAAIGNRKEIELKPGYTQRPILWAAVVAPPGSAKTPAGMAANAPLLELQREAKEAHGEALMEWESDIAAWEDAPKGERGQKPPRPVMDHFLTTDATIESLATIVDTSPGVVIFKDEIVGWVTAFDAYRKGGERQAHLSMWAGVPLKVDRRSRDPMFVAAPVACVSGGVQPDMLSELADEAGRRDGFLERLLWAMPETTPAFWTEQEIPAAIRRDVLAAFRELRTAYTLDQPVRLSAEAREVWREWHDENALITRRATGFLAGIHAKMPNQVARLALILHCIEKPTSMDRALHAETMHAAIEIGEYHRAHAHRALSLIADVGILSRGLVGRIRRALALAGDGGLTRSELSRKLGGHVDAPDLTEALDTLRAKGIAECTVARDGDGQGRRGERWTLTPRAAGQTYESNETIGTPYGYLSPVTYESNETMAAGPPSLTNDPFNSYVSPAATPEVIEW